MSLHVFLLIFAIVTPSSFKYINLYLNRDNIFFTSFITLGFSVFNLPPSLYVYLFTNSTTIFFVKRDSPPILCVRLPTLTRLHTQSCVQRVKRISPLLSSVTLCLRSIVWVGLFVCLYFCESNSTSERRRQIAECVSEGANRFICPSVCVCFSCFPY